MLRWSGVALLGLAVFVAVFGSFLFTNTAARWIIAAILLLFGLAVVSRASGGRKLKRRQRKTDDPIWPRVAPLRPGETYDDAVKLTTVANVPLASLWCQRLRENGIEAFYKGGSPFGAQGVGIADLNPALPAEIWVGEHEAERARQLFPELRH